MPESPDDALGMNTSIVYERGEWVVYMDVLFPGETRRFRIGTHRTQQRAEIAATLIHRYADQPPPFRRAKQQPQE